MHPRSIFRLLLPLLLLVPFIAHAADGFTIDNFNSDITINPDSSLSIRETIDVTFDDYKHGIYRKIPIHYDPIGKPRRDILISDIDTGSDKNKITYPGDDINIRLGDADYQFPPGTQHTYTISYTVRGALNFFDQQEQWEPHAELYWNVTGWEWTTNIVKTQFTVHFPTVPANQTLKGSIYYGPYGSTTGLTLDKPGTAESSDQTVGLKLTTNSLQGYDTNDLPMGSNVTFVVGFPRDLVKEPSALDKFFWNAQRYWPISIPFIGAILVFPFWIAYGRKPQVGTEGPIFEAPKGVDPTVCGYLVDNRIDSRDITAGLVSLAVKGYLKFRSDDPHGRFDPDSSSVVIVKPTPGSDLGKTERALLVALGTTPRTIPVDSLRYELKTSMRPLVENLQDQVVSDGYYQFKPTTGSGGCAQFFVFGYIGFFVVGASAQALATVSGPLIFAVIGLVIVGFIYYKIWNPLTTLGALKQNECKGLYEAIHRRANYMDWFSKTNLDMAKYEELLPYAVAFGLTKEWSNICGDVLTQAPSFCEYSSRDAYWDYAIFSSSFNNSIYGMNHEISAPLAESLRPPASSASGGGSGFSSGGGFSGGGFGGGGGGSW